MKDKHLKEAKAKYGKDISWAIQVGYAAAIKDAKLSNDELLAKIKVTQEKYRKIREERAKEKKC